MTIVQYKSHKASGTLDILRSDEIANRIRQKYNRDTQIALIMDFVMGKKIDEWNAYQGFRAEVKAQVDAEMRAMEAET